jgi:SPP1 gp7 family putative phage head morphogenesis protein
LAKPAKVEEDYEAPEAKPKSEKSDAEIHDLYLGTSESSFQVSPYVPDSLKKPYNPDPLVMKDMTYGIYEDMLADDQIDVALKIKKDLVVGSGWYIETLDKSQADIKKDLENSLSDDTDRPLSEILEDMCQAYEYGFSLSEKVFKKRSDGKLALKNIKPRHPASWEIHTDDHGNVTRFKQRGPESVDINPDALIHYVNNEKFQNPYGRSDLFSAYQAWITKRHITRFYAIYLETAAAPKPIGKYDRKAPQSVVDDIFQSLKKLATKTAMAIPKEFEVEFLEAKTNGEAFTKGINLFNMFIGRALFIPDLLGFQGSETGGGSFSLGKEQIGLFFRHIYRRRAILERMIDQHIIKPLVIYNYGVMDDYPKFKFNPLSDDDAAKQAEMWIKGVQGAGWKPTPEEVNHFRKLVKFPQSEVVELKMDAVTGQLGPDGKPLEPELDEDGKPVPPEDGEKPAPGEEKDSKEKPEEKPDKEAEVKKKAFGLALSTLPGNYKKKVDFKLADQILKVTVAKIEQESRPIVEDIFEDLYDQLQKKKIIEKGSLERAGSLQLKYLNRFQQVFKKHFRRLYQDAQVMAKNEVKKGEFATNVPADEFLEFLDQETYKYVGDWSYKITSKAKDALVTAIKDGQPLSTVLDVLDDEGKTLSTTSLERFARTKSTEVFNRGRHEYFNSTGVVAAYQYSAIIDDVTSAVCGELNGKIFDKDSAPMPPLHFNCRSVLIPITKFEDHKIDTETNDGQSLGKFLEENVTDKGFSVN